MSKKLLKCIESGDEYKFSRLVNAQPKVSAAVAIAALKKDVLEYLHILEPYVDEAYWLDETIWKFLLDQENFESIEYVWGLAGQTAPKTIGKLSLEDYLFKHVESPQIKELLL